VEYSKGFQHHSYLWLDDRQVFLKQFLMYSRQLTPEEMDIVTASAANEELPGLKESPPTTKQFKDQVIVLAALHATRVYEFIRGKIHLSQFTYLLIPCLNGQIRLLVSFITDDCFSLLFGFCCCLFTFSCHKSFSIFFSHL
jgi:hypothetical protein